MKLFSLAILLVGMVLSVGAWGQTTPTIAFHHCDTKPDDSVTVICDEGYFILKFYPKLDTTYELDYFSDEGTHGTYLPDLDGTGDHKTTPNVYRHFDKSEWLLICEGEKDCEKKMHESAASQGWIAAKPKPSPVDVPAIQEKYLGIIYMSP